LPLWRLFDDIIAFSGLYLKNTKELRMLIASYDRNLKLLDRNGHVLQRCILKAPIEHGRVLTIPTTQRNWDNIACIIVGCTRNGHLSFLDKNFNRKFSENLSRDSFVGVSLLKSKPIRDKEFMIVGSKDRINLYLINQSCELEKKAVIPSVGVPTDILLYELKEQYLLITVQKNPTGVNYFLLEKNTLETIGKKSIPDIINQTIVGVMNLDSHNKRFLIIAKNKLLWAFFDSNAVKIESKLTINSNIAWKCGSIIETDNRKNLIIGSQVGLNELKRKNLSVLYMIDLTTKTIIDELKLPGWIKKMRILNIDSGIYSLILAGKRIFLVQIDESLREITNNKFDSVPWSLDILQGNKKVYVLIGFSNGEVALGELTTSLELRI